MEKITLPPVLQRYELKYLIPWSYVEPISDFVLAYCQFDHFSSMSKDLFYKVNGLYFDTRCNEFLEQRLWGKMSRFNMRVRSYESGESPPYYLEIKHKKGQSTSKYRATLDEKDWPSILTDPEFEISARDGAVEKQNKALYMRLAHTYAIEPKIFTQYKRRAFFSTIDEYARVTMDFDMKYREQDLSNYIGDPYSLVPDESLNNYDNETIYAMNTFSEASVVLELKCNIGQVPSWMVDLISLFQLKQVGFSKYKQSSLVSRDENGVGYMSRDRAGIVV